MSDRTPTPGTASAARMGEMARPTTVGRHKLSGTCPDGNKCTLPVYCSQLCSRLQSAEITAEMQANVRARRPTTKKPPAPPPADIRVEETPMDEPAEETVPPPVTATTDWPCKINGCTNPAAAKLGRYANLCSEHRGSVAKPKIATKTTTNGNGDGNVTGRSLVDLARDLVTTRDQLAELERQVEEKRAEVAQLSDELAEAAAA